MLALVRIAVPDRPGVLGDVASAMGAAGADIVQVQVLQSEAGRALDDLYVNVRDSDHLQRVERRLTAIAGLQVIGVRVSPAPTTGHGELELVRRMLATPARALQTLVDGVPATAGADWAAVVSYGDEERAESVVTMSPTCPGPDAVHVDVPLRLSVIGEPYAGTALVPLTGTRLGLVVVRESGPPYHQAELWRLEQVGAIAGNVLVRTTSGSPGLHVPA
jgi:ACT domain